jgi:hypothetical protein
VKRLLFLLLGGMSFVIPARAQALPEEKVFDLLIPDGPDPLDAASVGTIMFALDADARDGCRYYGAWDDTKNHSVGAGCYLDEWKDRAHIDCGDNSQASFLTMVTLDGTLPCVGFDPQAKPTTLFRLTAIELPDPGGLVGLVQWTAAAIWLSPLEAHPYP